MTPNPPPLKPAIEKRIRELVAVYKRSQARLRKELMSAALTDFQQFRYAEHLAQIEAIVSALEAARKGLSRGLIKPAYLAGTNITEWALEQSGRPMVPVDIGNRLHVGAIEAVADQLAADLTYANDSLMLQARRILRLTQQKVIEEREVNAILSQGLVAGETRRDVSRRLTTALQKEMEDGAKVVINGRKYDPASYAELVTRTRTREAVTEGAMRSAEAWGVYLFQWSVHENSCPVCQQWQGKVFSIIEGTGYPLLEVRPPAHPNCEHVLLAYVGVPGEEERLKEISSTRGTFVHGGEDYQRVLGGGKPSTKAVEWEDEVKEAKRLRRQAARDRAAVGG